MPASAGWSRGAFVLSPADIGGGSITTDSMLAVGSLRSPFAASSTVGGAEPPAPSF
jgi:hypothetical protein